MTSSARVLLTSADDWSRDLLLDIYNNGRGTHELLVDWAAIMRSAAAAWRAVPGSDPAGSPFEPARLTAARLAEGADQPDQALDPRTPRIAALLDELADTIPTQPSTPGHLRLSDGALRAGILHVGYLYTHAVSTSITHLAGADPTPDAETSWLTLQRVRGVEQLLDAHLTGHERSDLALQPAAEVTRALNGWLRNAYSAPERSDSMTQLILADTARSVLVNSARLAVHGAKSSQLDSRGVHERLLPAIREAARGWEDSRNLWAAMISPTSRQLPEVVATAHRLQQALRQPELTSRPAAHQTTIVSALVTVCEVALINERALTHPQLTAPASAVTELTTQAYDKNPHTHSWSQVWNGINNLEGTTPAQLPEIVRADVTVRARATLQATLAARSAGHILAQPRRLSSEAAFHTAPEAATSSRRVPRKPPTAHGARPHIVP